MSAIRISGATEHIECVSDPALHEAFDQCGTIDAIWRWTQVKRTRSFLHIFIDFADAKASKAASKCYLPGLKIATVRSSMAKAFRDGYDALRNGPPELQWVPVSSASAPSAPPSPEPDRVEEGPSGSGDYTAKPESAPAPAPDDDRRVVGGAFSSPNAFTAALVDLRASFRGSQEPRSRKSSPSPMLAQNFGARTPAHTPILDPPVSRGLSAHPTAQLVRPAHSPPAGLSPPSSPPAPSPSHRARAHPQTLTTPRALRYEPYRVPQPLIARLRAVAGQREDEGVAGLQRGLGRLPRSLSDQAESMAAAGHWGRALSGNAQDIDANLDRAERAQLRAHWLARLGQLAARFHRDCVEAGVMLDREFELEYYLNLDAALPDNVSTVIGRLYCAMRLSSLD
ncbi:hypothetical protein BOTBODRAFT_170698 [Botryobasidium botryosum FD-172 SS1]|uniref:Uncharacterized protein n=1 Tax=Botryobasidium botryosum (strain FD-172 SS1) TaxID=930990 RepID=A0A067MY55_BOTB1|nr:hypothetical protein BOTBODRAFT_170698 [Botryobasidium botryosum FD-172 SS1]